MSKLVTFDEYKDLLEDRPTKFKVEQVEYQKASKDEPHCQDCAHFFVRRIDGFSVCEILRTDDDRGIFPNYRCRFQTDNGEDYPLLEE